MNTRLGIPVKTAGRRAWITGSNKVNSDELTDPVTTTCGSNKVNSDELTDPVMTTCG